MRSRKALSILCVLASVFGNPGPLLSKADIGKDSYKALAKVHGLIENGQYEEATTRLEAIGTAKASSYERALLLQTRGHLQARKGRYREAIAALQACLALDALPKSAAQDARYLLIQMQAALTEWEEAAAGMDAWLAAEKRPSAQAHALAGSVYAQVKRLEEAAERLQTAIDKSKSPSELWFRQLAAVYAGAQRYEDTAALLTDMVRRFPRRKEYWLQLSDIHRIMKQDARALALLELAYRRGLAFDERELLGLADLLVHQGLPYRAGHILEKALRDGALASTAESWRRLSSTWSSAGEIRKALGATETALQIAPSAELHLRRARLAAEVEDWMVAHESAAAALSAARLENPGSAHLLRGIAMYNLDRRTDALEAFEQAHSYTISRELAKQWLDYLSPGVSAIGKTPAVGPAPIPDYAGG